VSCHHGTAFELKRIEEAFFRGGKILFGYSKFGADPAFHIVDRLNSTKLENLVTMLPARKLDLEVLFVSLAGERHPASGRQDAIVVENQFNAHLPVKTLRFRDARYSNERRVVSIYRSATPEFPA
jgi:hypothetical protein